MVYTGSRQDHLATKKLSLERRTFSSGTRKHPSARDDCHSPHVISPPDSVQKGMLSGWVNAQVRRVKNKRRNAHRRNYETLFNRPKGEMLCLNRKTVYFEVFNEGQVFDE